MKFKSISIFRLPFLFGTICLIISCAKSDNVDYDTKVRFFNVVNQAAQDFYLNGVKLSTGISYGSNSEYIVTAADKEYNIFAKNTGTTKVSDSINSKLGVGKNYSVYYYKTSATDSVLKVYEDILTPDTSKSRLFFINLGYSLKSKVIIRNESSSFTTTLGNGESSGYIIMPTGKNSKLYLNLADSTNVVDTISYTNFYKGKTYTILIDGVTKGGSTGKLRERLIANN